MNRFMKPGGIKEQAALAEDWPGAYSIVYDSSSSINKSELDRFIRETPCIVNNSTWVEYQCDTGEKENSMMRTAATFAVSCAIEVSRKHREIFTQEDLADRPHVCKLTAAEYVQYVQLCKQELKLR